jgi:hypothetical protein
MFNFSFKFLGVPQKTITKEKLFSFINEKQEEVVIAKRINFATFHSHALYRSPNKKHIGTFKVPFKDTIEAIIKRKFGATLFDSQFDNKCYWNINSEEEYAKFEEFVNEYKDIVFLRDHLDLSLALSMNFIDEETRTYIGELEYQAKFNNNKDAKAELTDVCNEWIDKFPFLKEADCICAMPGSSAATESLPHRIVSNLEGFDFEDISDSVSWTSKTRSVKDAESAE